jgi:hypothetical protein
MVEVADYWLGNTTDWSDNHNWYSGNIPGVNSCIIIPFEPEGSNYPTTNSGMTRQCRTMLVEPGVNIWVESGETFIIIGNQ